MILLVQEVLRMAILRNPAIADGFFDWLYYGSRLSHIVTPSTVWAVMAYSRSFIRRLGAEHLQLGQSREGRGIRRLDQLLQNEPFHLPGLDGKCLRRRQLLKSQDLPASIGKLHGCLRPPDVMGEIRP